MRIKEYHDWYEKHIMAPLWNKDINFSSCVSPEYYGTVRHHGPILALMFKQSICFYLHCTDGNGNSRYETYVMIYDKNNLSVKCRNHDSYISPPGDDFLLVFHNGINYFKCPRGTVSHGHFPFLRFG